MIISGIAGTKRDDRIYLGVSVCTLGVAYWHSLGSGRAGGVAVGYKDQQRSHGLRAICGSADLFTEHARLIMLYALCGFANIGSLGILIGGLSVLVPERKNEYLSIAKSVSRTLVNLITGAIVGLLSGQIFPRIPASGC